MQHMHIAQQCLLDTVFDRLFDLSWLLRWEISVQVAQNSMTIFALPRIWIEMFPQGCCKTAGSVDQTHDHLIPSLVYAGAGRASTDAWQRTWLLLNISRRRLPDHSASWTSLPTASLRSALPLMCCQSTLLPTCTAILPAWLEPCFLLQG